MLAAVTDRLPLRRDRAALLLVLLALLCYLPGFWWGAPHATADNRAKSWGVDDETPLGPLAEMHNIVQPKPDRNYGYPLLYSFMATAAYTPYLGALKATGRLGQVSASYPYGLADPVSALRTLTIIAHGLTVLLAVLVVLAAYLAGTTLGGGRGAGVLSALFALTLYPMFYYGRTGNVDVPMMAFLAMALAALARALDAGMTTRRAAWIGVFAGLALATKEAAAGALLPAALLVLVLGWRQGGWKVPAASLAAALLALGAGSGLFVEPSRWLMHVRFLSGRVQDVSTSLTVPEAYPFTLQGNVGFARALLDRFVDAMTLPGLLLGIGGAVAASLRDRRAALFALAIPSYVLLEFFAMRSAQLRYVLPAAWGLAVFAGWAVFAAWRSSRPVLRWGAAALGGLALALQVVYGASLTWEMLRDSRHAAAAWMAARLQPGDRVEFFGAPNKVPPLPAGVTSDFATLFLGMWSVHRTDSAMADSIEQRWAARPPALVIVMPDHSTLVPGTPYDASMPPALYQAMTSGRSVMRPAAEFQTAPLVPWLQRPTLDYPSVNPPIRIFAPSGGR